MSTHTLDMAPNVVSEEGFREEVARGWRIEVLCRESGEKRKANWYGVWTIRIISPDSKAERMLVTHRKVMDQRVFRTINGLIAFLADSGITRPCVPLVEGQRALQETE